MNMEKHHVYNCMGEEDYDISRPAGKEIFKEIISHIYENYIKEEINDKRCINILFLGTNSGINDVIPLCELLKSDSTIQNSTINLFCIDDSNTIQNLKKEKGNEKFSMNFYQKDIETYPDEIFGKTDDFDFVFSFFTLNHLTNWKVCIKKIEPLLKQDGKWFMLHYNGDPYVSRLENNSNCNECSDQFAILKDFHKTRKDKFAINYFNSLLGTNVNSFIELMSYRFSRIEIKNFAYKAKINDQIFTEDFYSNPKNTPIFWGQQIHIVERTLTADYKEFISGVVKKNNTRTDGYKYDGCIQLNIFKKSFPETDYKIELWSESLDYIYTHLENNLNNTFLENNLNNTFQSNNLDLLQLILINQGFIRETNFLSPIFWDFEQTATGIEINVKKSTSFESIVSTRNYDKTVQYYSTHLNLFTTHDKFEQGKALFSVADIIFKTGINYDWIFLRTEGDFNCEIIDNKNQKFIVFHLPDKYLCKDFVPSNKFDETVQGFRFNNYFIFNVDKISTSKFDEKKIFNVKTINDEQEDREKCIQNCIQNYIQKRINEFFKQETDVTTINEEQKGRENCIQNYIQKRINEFFKQETDVTTINEEQKDRENYINEFSKQETDIFNVTTIKEKQKDIEECIQNCINEFSMQSDIVKSIAERVPRFILLTQLGICINFTNVIDRKENKIYGNGSFLLNETIDSIDSENFIKDIRQSTSFLSQRYYFLKKCINLYTYLCIRPTVLNKLSISYSAAYKSAIKSAIAAIMSRNMSHNLGSHVISGTKNYLVGKEYELSKADNRGMHRLLQYLQERMDFISVIINTSSNGYTFDSPLNLKVDILDEIATDGRDKRHNTGDDRKQTKSFLLDYIVRSEDIVRDDAMGKIKLELMLLLEKEKKIFSFSSEANGDNEANEFNSIEFSVPFGINSRHAFLTIIENYIRNSAKHNTNACPNNTLLVSILIQEEKDKYAITIFDNKEKSKYFDGQKCLQESIKILNEDNTLNTENKGIKEMLICSAWLNNKYEDWSIIESKRGENQILFKYKDVRLSDITKGIVNSINEESNAERKKEKETRLIYYDDQKTALGIRFELTKHKYVYYYAETLDAETAYSLPSADFYIIELDSSNISKEEIEYILPKVICLEKENEEEKQENEKEKQENEKLKELKEELKKIKKNAGSSKEVNTKINTKDFLLKCYQAKYDYENRKILVNYYQDNDKYKEENNKVVRTEGQIVHSGLNRSSKVYVFSRHNDVPSTFVKFYEQFKSVYPSRSFLEGISGASYNYNLLINAPIKDLDFYKIIRSCDVKIGIVDERLYNKYQKLKFDATIVTDVEIEKYNEEIKKHRENALDALKLSDECYNFLYAYVGGDLKYRHQRIEEFLTRQNTIDVKQTYNRLYTEEKGIYIYNYDFQQNSIINLDNKPVGKINSEIEFLSIHYGILDKLQGNSKKGEDAEEKDIIKIYQSFISEIIPKENLQKTRVILHSGRGGVVKIANDVTFVPLSTIESCMDDCKYKLAQLFLNLKYKKQNIIYER